MMNVKELLCINETLLQEFVVDSNVVVWGVRANGVRLYHYLSERTNANVLCFVDNDKARHGETCCGKEIISPERLSEMLKADHKLKVVIATVFHTSVSYQLQRELGFHKDNIFYARAIEEPLFSAHGDERVNWVADVYEMEKHFPELQSVFNLLADKRSIDDLRKLLTYRLTYNPDALAYFTPYDVRGNGFPADIYGDNRDETIIDGGAYTGTSALRWLWGGCLSKCYSFEPEADNYQALLQTISDYGLEDRVTPVCKGLSDRNETLYFSGNGEGGTITEDSNGQKIDVVTLDSLNIQEKITLVKLNIEGSEGDALKGMEKLLRRDKPKLIISNHHHTKHFWEVPLIIHKINPEYKIFYRQMGWGVKIYDLLLYAV